MSRGGDAALGRLEERLGHTFADRKLLVTALTHGSARTPAGSYQRLEFLGDRVLGLVVAEVLFNAHPAATEGELSRRLAELVRKETCAAVASDIGLGEHVRFGGGKGARQSIVTVNVLGDVTEAVIAAIYLDGGLDAARRFIAANWNARVVTVEGSLRDPKTALQEWAQARGFSEPAYRIVERTGPAHDSRFLVEVAVGDGIFAEGSGRTRRDAEKAAAGAVLAAQGEGTAAS
jgi:ribonuclease-3